MRPGWRPRSAGTDFCASLNILMVEFLSFIFTRLKLSFHAFDQKRASDDKKLDIEYR